MERIINITPAPETMFALYDNGKSYALVNCLALVETEHGNVVKPMCCNPYDKSELIMCETIPGFTVFTYV